MAKPPMDPRLAQIRAIPLPQRSLALVSAIAAMVGPNSKELITRACQIRESDTPTAALRSSIMHLMRMAIRDMEANQPIGMPFATWMDDALRNAVPGLKEADPVELTINLMEFLAHLFGTDQDIGIEDGSVGKPSEN